MPNAPYHHQNPHLRRQQERSAATERMEELTPICEFTGVKCIYWQPSRRRGCRVCKRLEPCGQPCTLSDFEAGAAECPMRFPKQLFKEPS